MDLSKLRALIHKSWTGYDINKFKAGCVKANLKLLARLKPDECLESDSGGWLFKVEGRRERTWYAVRNFLRFNGLYRRVTKAIENTIKAFCYEIRTPIELKKIFIVQKKKRALLTQIVKQLREWRQGNCPLEVVEEEIDHFRRRLYVQIEVIKTALRATRFLKDGVLVKDVKIALKEGINPILSVRGFSGTYLMRGTQYNRVGVFKPYDEEVGAPNNPSSIEWRGVLGSRWIRRGVRVGECMHREVAASFLDEWVGLGVVPKTSYAVFFSPSFIGVRKALLKQSKGGEVKRGSFQEYIEGFQSIMKFEKSAYEKAVPYSFHALFALDLIIGHLDRHLHNILFDGARVIAIDNGLSFPDGCQGLEVLEWKFLPQAQIPFIEEIRSKVERIHWQSLKDYLIRKTYLPLESIERVHIRLALLQAAMSVQMVPSEILKLMTKENFLALRDYDMTMESMAKKLIR